MFILRINFPDYVAETRLSAATARIAYMQARIQYGIDNVSLLEIN